MDASSPVTVWRRILSGTREVQRHLETDQKNFENLCENIPVPVFEDELALDGFSTYFVEGSKDCQDELLRRTEHSL